MALRIETLSADEHRSFLSGRDAFSFLQTPAWGEVKREWRAESLGWRSDSGDLVGAGLVLYRRLPVTLPDPRSQIRRHGRSLAYLPDGPVIDWADGDLQRWLDPLVEHVAAQGAFGIRMGPPVVHRRRSAGTVKAALAAASDESAHVPRRLDEVPADVTDKVGEVVERQLRRLGWRPPMPTSGGFAPGQPRHVFQLPLTGRDADTVLAGMNQLWRRNIRKATKAGVEVAVGSADDLPEFQKLYEETAARDHFSPRPSSYFETMFAALGAEDPDRIRLYLGRHDGDLVAATIGIRTPASLVYLFGASSTAKRDMRGMNAVQWRMIVDALETGAAVYDLRGITDTLDPADPHIGLLQFKVGTGGEAVEYVGEWDLPISRLLYKAFDFYLRRRGG